MFKIITGGSTSAPLDSMQLDDAAGSAQVSVPGEFLASSHDWMRGHGTYVADESVVSTMAGTVDRVNKLVSVRALRGRYKPEVGDLIIGRIVEVQAKRWKVDASSRQFASLLLSSINLPGGVQRRKLESDELQMRTFFQEGDLLVAEVQALYANGEMSLHTRSLKFGKLRNGVLVRVQSQLIVRQKSHFHALPCGVNLIIGMNGWIWIYQPSPAESNTSRNNGIGADGLETTDTDASMLYSSTNDPLDNVIMIAIARTAAVIQALANNNVPLTDSSIAEAYEVSQELEIDELGTANVANLGRPDIAQLLATAVLSRG
ncbi:uncharacterized protein L969DRAFT_86167 [Mixia osmundae IAM 14324]|uniref:Uncharacterized protein n=1 Tax=Mixia osmundae (strain CBS 9802 / IAM 14324 / JCM 22182 / KY 12970) TaxID=764103 RepID=G7DSA6_MIXOS|nr:uncharacterized protein L969DRAFT_86167 [Mixia osmundae IAM 14324]KEI40918.1 hypothetical protein L969DRAFT_86167 [Mixia osmundae IAM 14324]GAA93466.1 hypothetical protein E5Q_00107 [Mixia osmundae IAM 14324]